MTASPTRVPDFSSNKLEITLSSPPLSRIKISSSKLLIHLCTEQDAVLDLRLIDVVVPPALVHLFIICERKQNKQRGVSLPSNCVCLTGSIRNCFLYFVASFWLTSSQGLIDTSFVAALLPTSFSQDLTHSCESAFYRWQWFMICTGNHLKDLISW